jgi:hypothetical protein
MDLVAPENISIDVGKRAWNLNLTGVVLYCPYIISTFIVYWFRIGLL